MIPRMEMEKTCDGLTRESHSINPQRNILGLLSNYPDPDCFVSLLCLVFTLCVIVISCVHFVCW